MKKKYDLKTLKYMSFFERLTGTDVKDCIEDEDRLIFIVSQLQLRRAVGRDGSNVKRIEKELNKRIKVVEYSPNLVSFIKSLIMPLRAEEIVEDKEKGIITIKSNDRKTKGLLIGKSARNLRKYEEIVKRYFDINEIKVE